MDGAAGLVGDGGEGDGEVDPVVVVDAAAWLLAGLDGVEPLAFVAGGGGWIEAAGSRP